jgi:hypothetical protein
MGLRFRAPAVVLTTGTFLGGRIHVGLSQPPGGRAGDPAVQRWPRACALPFRVGRLKTGTPPRIDGAASTSPHGNPARRRPGGRCSPSSARPPSIRARCPATSPAPTPAPTTSSAARWTARRCTPARSRAWARATAPRSRTRWCASPTRTRTRSSSSRKAWTPRAVPQRHLHQPALRRAAGAGAHHPGLRAGPHHPAGLRHRVRLLRPARSGPSLETPRSCRPVLRRPDQRHHRLRGGGRPGPAGRHQCRARGGRRGPWCRAATRPTSACWWTTWSPAAPPSPTACSPAAPSTGCMLREDNADLRLTPAAASSAWWTTSAGHGCGPSRCKRDAIERELLVWARRRSADATRGAAAGVTSG